MIVNRIKNCNFVINRAINAAYLNLLSKFMQHGMEVVKKIPQRYRGRIRKSNANSSPKLE